MADDKTKWMSSHELAKRLLAHRDNDVKVIVNRIEVPIAEVFYRPDGDAVMIELYDGEDLRAALVVPSDRHA